MASESVGESSNQLAAPQQGFFFAALRAAPGRFLCSREDMRLLRAAENDRRGRMEVEANQFSSLILMPPPLLRPYLKQRRDPMSATWRNSLTFLRSASRQWLGFTHNTTRRSLPSFSPKQAKFCSSINT
jgi:hypothetical protein